MVNQKPTTAQILAGNSSGDGQTASGNPQSYQAGQDALLAANRQQQLAAQRQAEAANRAAQNRPATNGSSGTEFTNVSFNAQKPIPMGVPDSKKTKRGK